MVAEEHAPPYEKLLSKEILAEPMLDEDT